ncbi:MAG: ArnT family glycosyltransferase [Anaerolineae bacterium]
MLLLLGATLRLAAFDETLIEADQAAILDSAFQVAHLRYLPLIGMKSSVGVMQTGIVPLLAAIPLFAVKRIIAVQWFFSILDLLALAWLLQSVRRSFGKRAALVSGLLYAAAPWVVLYARTIWYQSLVSALATVAFAAFLVVLAHRRRWRTNLAVAIVATTMMSMVHLAAAPWGGLLVMLALVIAWRRRAWRAFLVGAGASLIIALPYLVHLVRSRFYDLRTMLQTGSQASGLNTAAFRLALELILGDKIIANAHGDLWDRSVVEWDTAPWIVLANLVISVLWALWRLVRSSSQRPQLAFAIAWAVGVPSLFLLSNVHLQHFYLMALYPAPFVLVGAWIQAQPSLRASERRFRALRILRIIAAGALFAVALWWSSLWLVRIRLESEGQLQRYTRGWLMDEAGATVATYLRHEPDGQVLVLYDYGGEMSAFEWLRGYAQSSRVRVIPVNKGMVVPQGPACYLLGPNVSPGTLAPVAGAVVERPEMTVPADPPWRFFCGTLGPTELKPEAVWTSGLSLLDTAIEGEFVPGGQLELVHRWHYRATNPAPYHFFNHLLLNDSMVAQIDGGSVPHWHWRDGDVLLTTFTLELPDELPSGSYELRVGMYSWPDLTLSHLVTGEDSYRVFATTR